MSLTDRLRAVVRSGGSAAHGGSCSPDPPYAGRPGAADGAYPASADPASTAGQTDRDRITDVLGGEWREWRGQPYLVVDRTYLPGHRHGRVAVVDGAPGPGGSWPALAILEPAMGENGRVVFIDIETTGLAGGAGTYAFLIGCAWFDGGVFRVRQFLLASYAAERGILEAVRDLVGSAGALATYNGKSFDLPVVETRFVLHRMAAPFGDVPHLDMLHQARRLWKAPGRDAEGAATCRLTAVEAAVLGHVREGDVPGFEIPSRYFRYVRSGDPRPLAAVLEHNRLDLLSLALLTARVALLAEQGVSAAATACEALGLGRLYQRAGRLADARACYARAAGLDAAASGGSLDTDEVATRAEALRAYASLCRRAREHDAAAAAWHGVLDLPDCPPPLAREAREALAVHYEHRLRDFQTARRLAMQALQCGPSTARAQAVHYRVARLDRKLSPTPTPFF